MSEPEKPTTPEDIQKLDETLHKLSFAMMKHLSNPDRFAGKNSVTFTDADFGDMCDGLIERLAEAAACWEFGDKATTLSALREARERVDCLLIIVNGKDV